ncbi:hypothetical protein ACWGN5_21885 [Streptomyces sp. NPDC055815]
MPPRLQVIIGELQEQPDEPLLRQNLQDARQPTVVLRFRVDAGVELLFL